MKNIDWGLAFTVVVVVGLIVGILALAHSEMGIEKRYAKWCIESGGMVVQASDNKFCIKQAVIIKEGKRDAERILLNELPGHNPMAYRDR